MRIIERSSGFWVVDDTGPIEGPFLSVEVAQSWLDGMDDIHADRGEG